MSDLVVNQHPVAADLVARTDSRSVKPPFITTKEHVRAGHVTLNRRLGAVSDGAADRKGLGRDDSSQRALRGVSFVVIQPVGVLHSLDPPPDISDRDRLL